jgi:phenylalanine-4-hydroxylase
LRIFGAGILSSPYESVFSLEDASANRVAFDLRRVMRTRYIIDDFQQTYFVIDSFEGLLAACYADFTEDYAAVRHADPIEPHAVVPSDLVLHRGTGAYFAAKRPATAV